MLSSSEILGRLNRSHPRLILAKDAVSGIRANIERHPLAKKWYESLRAHARQIIKADPSRYDIPDGLRLLGVSRRVLDRVYTLALIYLLDGDRVCVERVWAELDAAAGFPDWNPRHFLDTAEMTHAFAIAYDWLYDAWTPERRAKIRAAMLEKGLLPGLECYRGKVRYGWWVACNHNWNQVCNGGIGIGALAIADELPDVAGEILSNALQSLKLPMGEFAPDGAWGEGPGYWNYAVSYNVYLLACLETALGADFGFSQAQGFAETGLFPIYMSGPDGRSFNFADAHEGVIRAPQMFWLARKFSRPVYSWYEQQRALPGALDLVWFTPEAADPASANLPLGKYFRHVEAASMRSAWNDPKALFVGLKAGDNKVNHSNLDLGSFVLDALGHRWALDMGPDNYNLPGYFGGQRWSYYRLRAEGHNTLVIGPGPEPDQDPRAAVVITRFESDPKLMLAAADLTPAYAGRARRVLRTVKMADQKAVFIEDEVSTVRPADVWWFMHTRAQGQPNADGRRITLVEKDARLRVDLLEPAGAAFTIMDAVPLPSSPKPQGQADNKGIRKLAIRLADVSETRIIVKFSPVQEGGGK